MKKNVLVFLLLTVSLGLYAQNKKIAGFWPDYATKNINNIQYSKLTDIYYAFIWPTTTAVLQAHDVNGNVVNSYASNSGLNTIMKPLLNKAVANNVKMHVSVGGNNLSSGFSTAISTNNLRTKFADSLAAIVSRFNLDGVNIDWEFPAAGDVNNFATFITLLNTKLDAVGVNKGKAIELSIAVGMGVFDGDGIAASSSIFSTVDYIFLMGFDAKGNCCVCDANNHSSQNVALNIIKKWSSVGVSGACGSSGAAKNALTSKFVLGLPAYSGTGTNYNKFSTLNNTAAAYFNDADGVLGGYDYNSCPMIQTKVTTIMSTYSGAGVWFWELDADRDDAYSLLGCAYTAMQPYMCAGSQPSLGADVITCSNSSTLNSGVAAGNGITFKWYKDDALINGATSTSYSATSAGNYKVVVDNNGCSKSDVVAVSFNQPLATSGDTVCTTSELAQIKVLTPGGPYSWYAASSGGSALATGSTYTTTVSATKDFYVEGLGGTSQLFGPQGPLNNVNDQGGVVGWYQDGIYVNNVNEIDTLQIDFDVNVTLDSISVFADYHAAAKQVKFTVLTSSGAVVFTRTWTLPIGSEGWTSLYVGGAILAGTDYKFTLNGTTSTVWYDATKATYPYVVAGIGKIKHALASWGSDNALYPSIYDMKVTVGNYGGCGRQAVKVLLDPCTNISTIESNLATVYPNPSTSNFTIDLISVNEVRSVELYDISGKLIQTLSIQKSKISFGEELTSGVYFVKINSISGTQNVQVIKN